MKQDRNDLPDWVKIGNMAQCRENGRVGRIDHIDQHEGYTEIGVEYDDELGQGHYTAPLEYFRDPDEQQGLDTPLLVEALFDAVEELSEYHVSTVSVASRDDEGRIVLHCVRKPKEADLKQLAERKAKTERKKERNDETHEG